MQAVMRNTGITVDCELLADSVNASLVRVGDVIWTTERLGGDGQFRLLHTELYGYSEQEALEWFAPRYPIIPGDSQ